MLLHIFGRYGVTQNFAFPFRLLNKTFKDVSKSHYTNIIKLKNFKSRLSKFF